MKKNDKLKLFFYVLALIIFLEPQGFKEVSFQFSYFDNFYKIFKLFIGTILIFNYFLTFKKRNKFDLFIGITVLYQFFLFLSTIINKGDIVRFAGPSITVLSMAILVREIIFNNMLLKVIKIINIYFFICYLINIISIFIIGLYDNAVYFLGIDNRFICTFFPWIICVGIESLLENGKYSKKYYITLFLIMIILVLKWSVSAMLGMLLFILPPVLKIDVLYSKFVLPLYLIFNMVVTKFNLGRIKFLNFIVVNILKKDMTYSGRTFLWNGIYEKVVNNPLLGFGMQSIETDKDFFFSTSGIFQLEFLRVIHAHNSFMTILYRGGILSLISYILVLFLSLHSLYKNSKNILSPLFLIGCISIFILSLFDTIDFSFIFFFFGLCYYIQSINKSKKCKKCRVKVLYAVYRIDNGGIEQMLYNYISNIDSKIFDFDIVTQYPVNIDAEKKFLDKGVTIYHIPPKKEKFILWFKNLYLIMKKNNYDIVHSNINSKNFYILFIAKLAGVKIRIAHSHTAALVPSYKKFIFSFYKLLTKYFATNLVACGETAGQYAFGKNARFVCIENCVDVNKFKYSSVYRKEIRNRLNILDDELCIGHIGRFEVEKNHKFIVNLAEKFVKKNRKIKFLLIGDGELKDEIVDLINCRGLQSKFIILNSTSEIYKYYSAMDVFILPSYFEGLPLTGVEAQCSGLKCYFSSNISEDVMIVSEQCNFLEINNINVWMQILKSNKIDRTLYFNKILESNFNIKKGANRLSKYYMKNVE